jgi:hypothetical protein
LDVQWLIFQFFALFPINAFADPKFPWISKRQATVVLFWGQICQLWDYKVGRVYRFSFLFWPVHIDILVLASAERSCFGQCETFLQLVEIFHFAVVEQIPSATKGLRF